MPIFVERDCGGSLAFLRDRPSREQSTFRPVEHLYRITSTNYDEHPRPRLLESHTLNVIRVNLDLSDALRRGGVNDTNVGVRQVGILATVHYIQVLRGRVIGTGVRAFSELDASGGLVGVCLVHLNL